MAKEDKIVFCTGGGCTAKLGAGVLSHILEKLPRGEKDPDLLVGYDSRDDAAVYRITDDIALVQTVDFFPPMVDDPYIFGQIAAANALSDVYAMGGEVKTALNLVCFPESMDLNILGEILRGGAEKVAEAGGILAGGHSIADTGVIEKEFVPAAEVAANKTKLDELTKQLAARDKDLAKLKADNKSEELQKQLDELNAKYKQDTDDLNAKLSAQQADFAAEKLFGGYKFASDRVRKSVLDEFKGKGFKLENGEFVGGKEYLEGLKQSEPSVFAAEQKPGLFMGSTQSTESLDANNLETQVFSGFGLSSK